MKTLVAVLVVLSASSVFAAPPRPIPKMLVFRSGKVVTPMNIYTQKRVPLNFYEQERPRVRPWNESKQLLDGTIVP